MPENGWRLVDRKPSWLSVWSDWDLAAWVRDLVVGRFVDDDLDPEIIGTLVEGDLCLIG
jgi:hypothetical protein